MKKSTTKKRVMAKKGKRSKAKSSTTAQTASAALKVVKSTLAELTADFKQKLAHVVAVVYDKARAEAMRMHAEKKVVGKKRPKKSSRPSKKK